MKKVEFMRNIQSITQEIFKNYHQMAELELQEKYREEEYNSLIESLTVAIECEKRCNQQIIENDKELGAYYNEVRQIGMNLFDLQSYFLFGNLDSPCYSIRIPRQLEKVIGFKDIRLSLPNGLKITGSITFIKQFIYTNAAISNSLTHDINYVKLLKLQELLRNSGLTLKEREALTRLKYYYIFSNPRAESIFLDLPKVGKLFPETPILSQQILKRNVPNVSEHQKLYTNRLLENITIILQYWFSCPNSEELGQDILDYFLRIELESILMLTDLETLEKLREIMNILWNLQDISQEKMSKFYKLYRVSEYLQEREKQLRK